ncbi:uncharacterized protein LOC107620365 [Arachis ipaensis]|uniref:At2g35280-like TPR domain-containing protein n=1 Tax=Arachis hypogaea TaxID=3818 RepID=A0A444X1T3_ARAHY|nr:uncharacterized protein LOC107620365 [Arachis ipaensis]XP_025684890.1 uncharacterized protein LOC112785659 [Arachis hypogaea]RYQ83605.1 hypothetical protein Ahy_B10g102351 [Arachis hypogaea]
MSSSFHFGSESIVCDNLPFPYYRSPLEKKSESRRRKRQNRRNLRKEGARTRSNRVSAILLPFDIWVSIASRIASTSIQDLFNMQVSCRLFAAICSSDAVYRHALVSDLPIACFLYYFGRPTMRFLHQCATAQNLAALLWVGMTALFWLGHHRRGIETLIEAAEVGNLEACYVSAMLLLSLDDKDEDDIRRGFEFFCVVRASGTVERCREVFTQVFTVPWTEMNLADPIEPVACHSGNCLTHGTMDVASNLSSVSCVQCLAKYDV